MTDTLPFSPTKEDCTKLVCTSAIAEREGQGEKEGSRRGGTKERKLSKS